MITSDDVHYILKIYENKIKAKQYISVKSKGNQHQIKISLNSLPPVIVFS